MPKSVVSRAEVILRDLEKSRRNTEPEVKSQNQSGIQLSFFQLEDPVLKDIRDQIKNLDIDNLTPIEALNKLNDIKRITGL